MTGPQDLCKASPGKEGWSLMGIVIAESEAGSPSLARGIVTNSISDPMSRCAVIGCRKGNSGWTFIAIPPAGADSLQILTCLEVGDDALDRSLGDPDQCSDLAQRRGRAAQ